MLARTLFAASACLALAARAAAKDDACLDDSKSFPVSNGGFEADSISGVKAPDFMYLVESGKPTNPTSWTYYDAYPNDGWSGATVVAANGNGPWGGLDSGEGSKHLVMQGRGVSVRQTISNLDPKKHYMLSWQGAERPRAHENSELFNVKINDDYILYKHQPADVFQQYNYQFVPDASGKAIIAFENESPGIAYSNTAKGPQTGLAVFFDKVQVFAAVDCDTGSTCHARPSPRTGYQCLCDEPGFVGASVTNGKAVCTKLSDAGAGIKELTTMLTAVKGTVKDLETSAKTARDDTGALQKTQVDISSRVASLEKTVAELQDTNAEQQKMNTEMKKANTALLASNEQFKTVIQRLQQSTVSVTVQDEPQPKPNGQAPEIETDGADVNIKPQAGRRLRVNDEPILTAKETTDLIKAAVEDALKAIADKL